MSTTEQPILLPLRAIPGSLFSFEALVVLYMFAGIYKGDPRFAAVPVDLTALFFALSVVVGSFIIVRNPIHRKSMPVIFAMVCLIVWLLVSLTWSPSRIYGPNKVFLMATLVLWAVIAGAVIISPDPERLRRLFTLLLLLSIWFGIDAVLFYIQSGGNIGQIRLRGASYLGLGRLCGLGALIALMAGLYGRGTAKLFWLIVFAFLGFVLAIGGGRGPLLAAVFPPLLLAGLGIRFTRTRILYWPAQLSVLVLLLAVAGGLLSYGAVTEHRLSTFQRLAPLLEGNLGRSAGARAESYGDVVKLSEGAPLLGHGFGSWPLLTGRPDLHSYPHNALAELLVEGGLIAVGLFLVVVAVAFRGVSFARLRSDPQALCIVVLFVNAFLNAMVTEDLPGNRAMFMILGVLALFAIRPVAAARVVAPEAGRSAAEPLAAEIARRRVAPPAGQVHAVNRDA